MESARAADLRRLLQQHEAADEREAGFVERMLGLLDSTADPFGRDHFEPGHFTASAFVLSPDRRRMLLILHGKFGLWLQPGGHVDPEDASIHTAALREVAEETGITGPRASDLFGGLLDVDIHDIPANPKKGEPPHQHFDVRFLFEADSDRFEAGSDAKAARWVELSQAHELDTDESVRRALRKLVGELL